MTKLTKREKDLKYQSLEEFNKISKEVVKDWIEKSFEKSGKTWDDIIPDHKDLLRNLRKGK